MNYLDTNPWHYRWHTICLACCKTLGQHFDWYCTNEARRAKDETTVYRGMLKPKPIRAGVEPRMVTTDDQPGGPRR